MVREKTLTLAMVLATCTAIATPALAARPQIKTEDLQAMQVGVTTYADVVARFGEPISGAMDSQGNKTAVYQTIRSHVKATSFIPFVGLVAGGATGDVRVVTLVFGADGRLTQYQATDGRTDCTTAIFGVNCRGGGMMAPATPAAPTPAIVAAAPAPSDTVHLGAEIDVATVIRVIPGSVAERGGLRPDDTITVLNGHIIDGAPSLSNAMRSISAGQPVSATVRRGVRYTTLHFQF